MDNNKNDNQATAEKAAKDQYKETVFLPKTDFPMRGGLPTKEPEMVKKWQEMNLYGALRAQSKDLPKWVLHDGPPYANGHIHMGHALNKILKDVIVKSYQMMGYNAPYVPGWDCHGLPIEWKIEEQYRAKGLDKDEVDTVAFRQECREFAKEWVSIQSEEFQRLGVTGDWDTPYLTMTNPAEAQITREIHKFLMNGGLYKGVKPVMWSPVEKTALAEAEVEYKEHKSITIWIRFPVVKTNCKAIEGADIVIWTTTPWTMPSNRAVAYGPQMEYGVYEITAAAEGSTAKPGDKLVLATSLAESTKEQAKITDWALIETLSGADIAGTVCHHPLHKHGYDFDVPALEADFVTEETGTGFVHIAPGHGQDDFFLGTAHGIEVTDNVDDAGVIRENVPLFGGAVIYDEKGQMGDANGRVIKAMAEEGALLAKGSLRHEYPHSWRSKAPVIFRTTPQWFISMETNDLRQKALAAIKDTKWVPAAGEKRITAMIEGRPDWCISRQRAWGVPIALFLDKQTGELLKDEAVNTRIAAIFEKEGSDAWWARPAEDFLGSDYSADDYDQIFDIVDVWFDSGSTHTFVLGDTDTWPDFEGVEQADMYLEGSDQHRGWFHSSLLECCGTRGRAPYKTVLTHGFVLDEKGYKMSKSMGNVVDPLKMMKQYGADILRLWTMTSDYAEDLRIGENNIKAASDLYRRIRNTLRFLLGALDGFTEAERLPCHPEHSEGSKNVGTDSSATPQNDIKKFPELEQLMLHQLATMDSEIRDHIENFEFGRLAHKLHNFCNNELSAFYFDIRKDRLYCDRADSFERRATRTVMAEIFNCLTAWLAPTLAFTAEEAWSHRPAGVFEDAESIHLRTFPDLPESWKNEELATKWGEIKAVRKSVLEAIEPLRADKTLGSSLEALPLIQTESDHVKLIGEGMADVCITSQIKISEGASSVTIEKASGHKCARCWKVLPEVEEGGICNRCADAVDAQKKAA